ncbi:MAG TPA: helix-turn-helix transcriptional regulator [Deltaproteobacteria bacterium]|nr:helix-turn-helix transcriptional regulator [Deltaproteobacteria bacterium]
MPYISLSMAELKKTETAETDDEMKLKEKKSKKVFRHPVRNRIVDILRDGEPRTQQELGALLSMSNAAVHYHVKLLLEVGIIKLHRTRPGPKGITEKLYTIAVENWPDVSEDDLDYYLSYMVSWINERNREGLNLLKSGSFSIPFLTGSYSARAPLEELIKFKRKVEDLFNEFYSKCESLKGRNRIPFAVTFSMIPSREKNKEDSRNILEFEPEHL